MKFCKYVRALWAIALAIVMAAAMAGWAAPSARAATGEVIVSAAVSLKDALDEIAQLYRSRNRGANVRLNLGGSGTLQRQIEQGAPVDVFISASPQEMDALAAKALLLAGTRHNLLENRVVLIVPSGESPVANFKDLVKPEVKQMAIGEPQTVPAGMYAQQVLMHLGLYDRVKPKFIFAKDVRQVLTYVASGNVDAGIVYATDAKVTSKVTVVATAPEGSHSPVIYPVAIMKNAPDAAGAKEFEAFLLGPQAKEVFAKYGFIPARQ